MKKTLLAAIAALSVLSASAAHATEYQGNLPKPVQKLPAYPPVVCVAPNWATEPCEARNEARDMLQGLWDFLKWLKWTETNWLGTILVDYRPWDGTWPKHPSEPSDLIPEQETSIPLPQPRPASAPIIPGDLGTYWDSRVHTYWPKLIEYDYELLSSYPSLPPKEYDHPFTGRLRVVEVDSMEAVFRVCQRAWWYTALPNPITGCAIFGAANFDPLADCVIIVTGIRLSITIRHEIGHCNGWHTHEGMRNGKDEAPANALKYYDALRHYRPIWK